MYASQKHEAQKHLKALRLKHPSVTLPNGNIVVGVFEPGVAEDNELQVFNPTTGQLIRSFPHNSGCMEAIASLPDGNIVIGGGQYNQLCVFNPENGSEIRSFQAPCDRVSTIVCLPNGNILVGGFNQDSCLHTYNPTTGEHVASYIETIGGVSAMALLPNGSEVVISRPIHGDLLVLDTARFECQTQMIYATENDTVGAIFCLSNQKIIVGSSSANGMIRIIDLNNRMQINSIPQTVSITTSEQLKDICRKEMEKNYQVIRLAQKRATFFALLPAEIVRKIVLISVHELFNPEASTLNQNPSTI